MVHNKKTYHWCIYHGENDKWVKYHPDQCEVAKKKAKQSDDPSKTSGKGDKDKQIKLQVLTLQSILEEDDF